VFWCYEDQTADEVADYMAEKEIRRVLILNCDKRLVGVISIGNLAKGGQEQIAAETIKDLAAAPRTGSVTRFMEVLQALVYWRVAIYKGC
jgi:hypothetical protein